MLSSCAPKESKHAASEVRGDVVLPHDVQKRLQEIDWSKENSDLAQLMEEHGLRIMFTTLNCFHRD